MMLEMSWGDNHTNCEGVSRRSFLRYGIKVPLAGGLAFSTSSAHAQGASSRKAVILIWLAGGPSHIDMYDLKPQAPIEYRGEFRPIATNVSGVEISEHLPLQAKIFDKLAVVRSAFHTNAGHGMGSQWMLTGYQPTIEVNDNIYPSCGSVVARLKGANRPNMPAYVNLPYRLNLGKAAYLGAAYNPFAPDADPNSPHFQVRNLRLPGRIDPNRLERRQQLLQQIDRLKREIDSRGDMAGYDRFYQDAFAMMTSEHTLRAFDIHQEDPRLREKYGRNDLGQSCLLARRLVEAGVSYVTIQAGGGWDTHANNFAELKNNLLPKYDRAVYALVEDLYDRGMQQDVLVMSMGEFGRTPRINGSAGRDHWPGAMCVLYAGGGLRMGQVVGSTDSKAESPTSRPYTPGCVLATMYHVLGIDYRHVFYDQAQRPLPVLNEGGPIPELVG